MTPEQAYGQVCTWFAEGRLRVLVGENYTDWTASAPPNWEAFRRDHNRQRFCRREDEPEMPDEVFLSPNEKRKTCREAYVDEAVCSIYYVGTPKPVRYIRAGAVISGVTIQTRPSGSEAWIEMPPNMASLEYRLKP